jgi:hypothetical protein
LIAKNIGERLILLADDPSDALETVEAIMDEITAQQIKSGDLMIRHFVTYTLQRIVVGLLKRRYTA